MTDDGLSALKATGKGPVAIVFATVNYQQIVWRWIQVAHWASVGDWRIVCLERELVSWLERKGEGARAVYYYDLVPDAPRYDFANLKRKEVKKVFWPLRTRLFVQLANAGCDFVHSDADAFWIRDPRPYLAEHPDFDLLVSQGTWFPREHLSQFGFVLCAGFFLSRSNARTRDYFERVHALMSRRGDDQWCMNNVLLQDPEAQWEVRAPVLRRTNGRRFRRRVRSPIPLRSNSLPWDSILSLQDKPAKARYEGSSCILTSKSIIRGKFSGGLTIGVIPMHLVTRKRVTWRFRSLVMH